VHFVGHVPDHEVVAHLHACDLFALPSVTRAETFGVVQLEAMACGKPVVSTNLPTGVPWVNQHDVSGLVVEPSDVIGLGSALRRLLEDDGLRERLGDQAQRRVVEAFTIGRMTAQSATLYEEVADTAGAVAYAAALKV
jgi:rhamnosyl/mannosyltransferase